MFQFNFFNLCQSFRTILSGLPYLGFGSPGVIDGIQISCGLNYRDKSPENRAYIFVSFFLGFVGQLI